jgi:hypothetical protein
MIGLINTTIEATSRAPSCETRLWTAIYAAGTTTGDSESHKAKVQ